MTVTIRAGNHTWDLLQPIAGRTTNIDEITGNLTSAWTIETRAFDAAGSQWGSNTPGMLRVGRVPWRDDGSLNGRYYRALEDLVQAAERRDITVVVRLFEGTFQGFAGGWANHWSRDLKHGPAAPEHVHTRGPWNTHQRAHVKRVAKTLAPFDNVIGHAGNELHRNSIGWFQPAVVRWWQKWSDSPIAVGYAQGMKPSAGRSQDWMARTGADILSPAGGQRITGHRGPYIFDTDHSWPLRSNPAGLRAAFGRGDAILLMDGLSGRVLRNQASLAPDRAFIDSIV
jgi:hypothetical protein